MTVTWNWADEGGSGIDESDCTTTSTSTSEGSAIELSATCGDLAGNQGSASYTVKVDKTAPVVTCGQAPTFQLGGPGGWVPASVSAPWPDRSPPTCSQP